MHDLKMERPMILVETSSVEGTRAFGQEYFSAEVENFLEQFNKFRQQTS